MGLIALPPKIDKAARFKAHMKEFFKDAGLRISNTYTQLATSLAYDMEYYDDSYDDKLPQIIDDWINTLSAILPENCYIFNYPNFYLPILANKPEVVFAKSMLAQGKVGWGFFGVSQNVLVMNIGKIMQDPKEVLVTAIHEYGHKQTRIDEVLPTTSLNFEGTLTSWFGNAGFDEWGVDVDNEQMWHTRARTYASIRSVADVEHYTSYKEWLDEIAVRLKSRIAIHDEYHSLDDFFWSGRTKIPKADTIFTEKYQNYLNTFAWPDKKDIPMVKNK